MIEDKPTIQDIFILYSDNYIKNHNLSKQELKVISSIKNCKTKEMGIHKITCECCGEEMISYNSCRNRHCPMCQQYKKEEWIDKQNKDLLNCPYFHIVTTTPSELNIIALYNKKEFYNILFEATKESILTLCEDPKWLGAKVGITSILHTWGQTLELHPHIHSIVTGGGLTKNNKWEESSENYLIKVQVLTSMFKGKFLSKLKRLDLKLPPELEYLKDNKKLNKFLEPLYKKDWVTYIEPPKGSPENVIEYIGRYSFRVAISNNRIKSIDNGIITFEYKDYKDNNKIKIMSLSADEFIRRFLLHILPDNFTKIKHYGLFGNNVKSTNIKLCRILIRQYVYSNFTIKLRRKFTKFKCPTCGGEDFRYEFFYNIHRAVTE